MSLSIGLVGLPNVGKSTTFNALTGAQNAQVANYPFCTIEPNQAIVPLKDARVDKLVALTGVANTIYATLEFVDIAGLVAGASRGEGLGNQFLANIRNTDAILHVVRCFDDENVVHVSATPNPQADIETVNLELVLADLEQVERRHEKIQTQARVDKNVRPQAEMLAQMKAHLDGGEPLSTFAGRDEPVFALLEREMRFLTSKPVIYVANVDEAGLAEDNAYVTAARAVAETQGAQVVKLCAELEKDMAELTPAEQAEFLEMAGASESGLQKIVRQSFEALNLINFFTKNQNEVRAWTIPQGYHAPQAAGAIHTDFERGFIRGEVIPYAVFVAHGSDSAVKSAGAMRLEGKEYVVQDGDVILFRFNV
jgi:GTP-binding protein YchF